VQRNLGELVLTSASAYGDDVAFQIRRGFRLDRLTYRQVAQHARQVAGWLSSQGLAPGDRIVVWSPNMPEYALLYFGAWLAGIVVVPIDVRTRQEVLDRCVAASEPRLGFKSRFLTGTFADPVHTTFDLEELFDLVQRTPPLESLPQVGPEHLCEIAFTSGTTGVPKGVMLTHGNLLAEVEALRVAFPLRRSYRALSLLPLSHALEQVIDLLLAYSFGVRVTYLQRINPATIARTLREERITCLILVPQLLRLLLTGLERRARAEGKGPQWDLAHRVAGWLPFTLRRLLFRSVHQALGGHLTFFGSGGAPLDLNVAEAWERMGIQVFEGYGLTETSAASTINTWSAQRLGSVGKSIPGVELKIADDGEILIRGQTVTTGYFRDPDLTRESFTDDWFHSSDVGSIDADGFLHIVGREAFKIVLPDGRNVYPEDVERALNLHPLVRESCVVAIDQDGGAHVHAVMLTPAPERAADIVRETNRQLEAHQQIAGYTVWAEEDFPRTPTLKVDRKLVREAIERQQATTAGISLAEPTAGADPLTALIARVAERPIATVRDEGELFLDLGLDSLGRVELLAAIEEELGRVVGELEVTAQTTVGELRRLVAAASTGGPSAVFARWQRSGWARAIGGILLRGAFRIQDHWMQLEIVHRERATVLPFPSLLIFNYQGPYAPLALYRAIPAHLRDRVALANDSRVWQGSHRWQGMLTGFTVQAFPFAKSGGAVRSSLEELGRWLDDGYAVIISPEGEPEVDGELLPFLRGTGLMAVEMQVPVVPFVLENYWQLFPREQGFPYLPHKRGRIRLTVGEPITFPPTMSHDEATARLREVLLATTTSSPNVHPSRAT
jgi:long-chain acyl-CoA synthetase